MSLIVTFTVTPEEVSITRTTELSREGEVLEKTPDRGWVHYRTYGNEHGSGISHATPLPEAQAQRRIDGWRAEALCDRDSDGHTRVSWKDEEGFQYGYSENAERTCFEHSRDVGHSTYQMLTLQPHGWVLEEWSDGEYTTVRPEQYPTPEEAGAMVAAWKKEAGL